MSGGDGKTELKPTQELIRIFGMQDEAGKLHGFFLASGMQPDLIIETLQAVLEMYKTGKYVNIKAESLKDVDHLKIHAEQ